MLIVLLRLRVQKYKRILSKWVKSIIKKGYKKRYLLGLGLLKTIHPKPYSFITKIEFRVSNRLENYFNTMFATTGLWSDKNMPSNFSSRTLYLVTSTPSFTNM